MIRFGKLPLFAAFAAVSSMFAGVALVAPASASGSATYTLSFNFDSTVNGYASTVFFEPTTELGLIGTRASDSAMQYVSDLPAGASSFSYTPYFFNDIALDTPVVSTVFSLSTTTSGADDGSGLTGGDPGALHFIVSLDASGASVLSGQSFADAFSGFAAWEQTHDSYLYSINSGVFDEQLFVNELLETYNYGPSYGLPDNPYFGTPTNLLFDFGDYLHSLDLSITPGSNFDLVAFSNAQIVGTGSVVSRSLAPSVPEPASWALMIGGLALIGAAARGRRPSTAAV